MYSIDINFLRDRAAAAGQVTYEEKEESPLPLVLGIALGIVPLVAAGGWWGFLVIRAQNLEQEKIQAEARLNPLRQQLAELDRLKERLAQIRKETQELANVVEQVTPWSAVVQDLANRTLPGIQLSKVSQSGSNLTITGQADEFETVNDFLLVLERSPFLKGTPPNQPQLIKAERAATTGEEDTRPLVQYELRVTLATDKKLSENLANLKRTGAVGLEARIEILRELGIIKTPPLGNES
ncbi:MAG: PilN domain-containing protein [Gloeomargarita sp. SKYB31]|nr:PilN domain-containing protein [Gloeomargarita sp. SKYG98]MCS7225456.1 PilN domain-containing protein [Gloeomargarita sp. SKYB31]